MILLSSDIFLNSAFLTVFLHANLCVLFCLDPYRILRAKEQGRLLDG